MYNVHNLIHIAKDVRYFNEPLQRISAFLFKTYLQRLKKYVKGKRYPLEEIYKRHHKYLARPSLPKKQNPYKISCKAKHSCF